MGIPNPLRKKASCVSYWGFAESLVGWMQWVNNTESMVKFTQEDLEKMNKDMVKFVRSFIEGDLEVTK